MSAVGMISETVREPAATHQAMLDALTILVPTQNRYRRLLRVLTYYQGCGCPFPMRVLDSSSQAWPDDEASRLLRADGRVSVTRYPPETEPLAKMLDGLQQVSTPYVVLWADDDFMVPGALEEGVSVLAQHSEVSVVHGQSGLFHVDAGHLQWVAPYLQRSIIDATASARLRNHLGQYSVMFYSVHRTEALKRNLDQVVNRFRLDWHTWGEIALSALAVIHGKAVTLSRLYMLREGHGEMWSAQVQHDRDIDPFDWLTDTTFSSQHGSYEAFRDCLVPELARQDGIDVATAREVLKQAFWPYLVSQMQEKWRSNSRAAAKFRTRVREVARRVPGLRAAWRAVRSRLPGEEFSLEALRRSSSRYYTDFLPVDRAIRVGVENPATCLEVPEQPGVESGSSVVEGRNAE